MVRLVQERWYLACLMVLGDGKCNGVGLWKYLTYLCCKVNFVGRKFEFFFGTIPFDCVQNHYVNRTCIRSVLWHWQHHHHDILGCDYSLDPFTSPHFPLQISYLQLYLVFLKNTGFNDFQWFLRLSNHIPCHQGWWFKDFPFQVIDFLQSCSLSHYDKCAWNFDAILSVSLYWERHFNSSKGDIISDNS